MTTDAGGPPSRRPYSVYRVVAAVVLAGAAATGCSALHHASADAEASPSPTVLTAPPAAASQPPGPPLATATAAPAGPVNKTDPASVVADCYRRWQSYDSRTQQPSTALTRAKACFTDDEYASLTDTSPADAAQAQEGWLLQRRSGTRSIAEIIGKPDAISGSPAAGRVVYLLHVRHVVTTDAGRVPGGGTIETPAVTMVRQPDGSWQIAGADRSTDYGNAPGA